MNKLNQSKVALCISLLLASSIAAATTDTDFDFVLDFEQHDIDLDGGTKLEQKTIGFRYSEYSPWPLRFDLLMGWTEIKHLNDAIATGHNPAGYYAGLGLSSSTNPQRLFQVGFDISYRYFAVNKEIDKDTDEQLDLDWTQTEAKLWLSGRVTERLNLYGCYYSMKLDGEQSFDTDPVVADQELKNKRSSGPCLGLKYAMPNKGFIGLEINDGTQQGGHIYFGKLFGR